MSGYEITLPEQSTGRYVAAKVARMSGEIENYEIPDRNGFVTYDTINSIHVRIASFLEPMTVIAVYKCNEMPLQPLSPEAHVVISAHSENKEEGLSRLSAFMNATGCIESEAELPLGFIEYYKEIDRELLFDWVREMHRWYD